MIIRSVKYLAVSRVYSRCVLKNSKILLAQSMCSAELVGVWHTEKFKTKFLRHFIKTNKFHCCQC